MNDLEIIRRLNELANEKAAIEKKASERLAAIKTERDTLQESLNRRSLGLDENKIALALKVVETTGKFENEGGCLRRAMDCLALGGDTMKTVAIAVKDYAQFHGQQCDCEYGYGPKHGWHVFTVGLTRDARKRELTEEERDAAIYYLVHFKEIEQARRQAAALASTYQHREAGTA